MDVHLKWTHSCMGLQDRRSLVLSLGGRQNSYDVHAISRGAWASRRPAFAVKRSGERGPKILSERRLSCGLGRPRLRMHRRRYYQATMILLRQRDYQIPYIYERYILRINSPCCIQAVEV